MCVWSAQAALTALNGAELANKVETAFVIGGGKVYEEALSGPLSALCAAVHLTEVQGEVECDTTILPLDQTRWVVSLRFSSGRPIPAR